MSAPVRTAVIGCGSLTLRGVLPHLSQPDVRPVVEVVAVADTVAERAAATAARFDVPRHTDDVGALLADDAIDLVLVITPIPHHHELVMAALEAGKHVYVQKAMATRYAQAAEMCDLAEARGLVLAAAPGQRLSPAVRDARAFVREGAAGPVYWCWSVTAGWTHEDEAPRRGEGVLGRVDPGWYYREGGGPVYDTAVYALHTVTAILGAVRRVVALSGTRVAEREWQGRRIPLEVHDNTTMLLDFGDNVFGFCGAMSGATGQLVDWGSFGVYGADGFVESLEIEPASGHPSRLVLGSADGSRREVAYGLGRQGGWLPHVDASHARLEEPHVFADIMDCAHAILEGHRPAAAADHAAHVVEVMERAYEAARTGTAVELRSVFVDA